MKEGATVEGVITAIKPYGAFVKIDEQYTGLIHISEFSDRYVRDIKDFVSIGDKLSLKVLRIEDDHKVSLSFKRLHKRKKRYRIELDAGFKPLESELTKWIEEYDLKDGE